MWTTTWKLWIFLSNFFDKHFVKAIISNYLDLSYCQFHEKYWKAGNSITELSIFSYQIVINLWFPKIVLFSVLCTFPMRHHVGWRLLMVTNTWHKLNEGRTLNKKEVTFLLGNKRVYLEYRKKKIYRIPWLKHSNPNLSLHFHFYPFFFFFSFFVKFATL